jgi:hypothetical protein
MSIYNPSSTAFAKQIDWKGSFINGVGGLLEMAGAAKNSGTAALTGIRFYAGAGNILAGSFRLYGLKNS